MPFVKLDTGILNSTLWIERDCREIFITALLMAEPAEITEDTPQLKVDSLEFTGFKVPPGWYGFVPAAGVGIARQAGIDRETGLKALAALGEPDTESRSKEFGGRRLVRVNGGYIVLNYIKYREKDATAVDRMRRYRERQKMKQRDDDRNAVTLHRNVTSNVTIAEVEVESYPGKGLLDLSIKGARRPVARQDGSSEIENSPEQNPPSFQGDTEPVTTNSTNGTSLHRNEFHELQYAARLMEEINMPNTPQNLRHVAAGIKAEESKQGGLSGAYDFVLARAREEIEQKGTVTGFWFQDAAWRKKKKSEGKGILGVSAAEIARKAKEKLK